MPAPSSPPTLTTPPDAPAREQAPALFNTRMRAFMAWLITFVSEMGTMATALYDYATSAYGSAGAAASSAGTATAKAGEASDSAEAAALSASAAAGSASTAAGWSATSTTSMALTSGSKTLTIQTAKQFTAGTNIKVKRTAAPTTTYAHTTVDTYNSGTGALTFTLASDLIVGSGTYTDWTIELSGARGATGSGDVNGPASATNNAVALYDGPTGKLLKDGPSYGTSGANKLLQLDSSGKLPAVDGSQLTGISAGLTLLATVTASNSATVDIEGYFTSDYDEYLLLADGIYPTAGSSLQMLLKVSGSYQTSGYIYAYTYQDSNSTSETFATATTEIPLSTSWNLTSGIEGAVEARFFRPASSTTGKMFSTRSFQPQNSYASKYEGFGKYGTGTQAAITGVRFLFSSGNVSTGTFRLYGFKK